MLDDIEKTRINPGYTGIGRLKGLAELRGARIDFDPLAADLLASPKGHPALHRRARLHRIPVRTESAAGIGRLAF